MAIGWTPATDKTSSLDPGLELDASSNHEPATRRDDSLGMGLLLRIMHAILQELIYDSMLEGAVWPFDRRYIRPPHFHGQLECLLVFRGTATLRRGTDVELVRAGQLCWILPGVPHVMGDFSPDFDMWVIQLDAALVRLCWPVMDAKTATGMDGMFDHWPLLLGERLAGRATVDVGAEESRRMSELALQVWGASSAITARRALLALGELAFRVTLRNVDEHREVSVAELASCLLLAFPMMDRSGVAAELGVSEGFLSRRFHAELGVTFVEQRARTRVAHFLALIQGGRQNLLGAALDAGFGSYSQFHRIFTRVSGSRPRDYLCAGRHRLQLLVSDDLAHPQSASVRTLPTRQRHRAPLDA